MRPVTHVPSPSATYVPSLNSSRFGMAGFQIPGTAARRRPGAAFFFVQLALIRLDGEPHVIGGHPDGRALEYVVEG